MKIINYSNIERGFREIYEIRYRREDQKNTEVVNIVAGGLVEASEAFYRYFGRNSPNPIEIPEEISEKSRKVAEKSIKSIRCLEGAVLAVDY